MAPPDGNLTKLHKGAGVRRTDLPQVLGRALLDRWGLTGRDLLATRIATICHLEAVLATFSEEKVRLTARFGYNMDPGLADVTGARLGQLSQLKGTGYSKPTTERILVRQIAPLVQDMLVRRTTPPAREHIERVLEKERAHGLSTRPPVAEVPSPQANGLRTAILGLSKPFAAADHAVDTFLRSRLYAPRPKDVGYVLRETSGHGYLMCVFSNVETLRVFQRANDPDWSGEYLAMSGKDLVNEVLSRLPRGTGIIVDAGLAENGVSASLSLPAELLHQIHTIG